MKNSKRTLLLTSKIKAVRLPLSVAMGSCLLVACSTPMTRPLPYTPPQQIPTSQAPTTAQTPLIAPTATPATTPPLLDDETLAILGDLLEARNMSMVEGDKFLVERYGNLWDRVRAGYRITQPAYNPRIEAQKTWFHSRQDYLNRLTARASRYLHHTVTEAERRGIPTELALLPIIESSYDPSATSNAAAAGLWQFIPSTGRIYGLNQSSTYDGRRDIIESTRAAYDFLTSLYNQFGSWELALAAYNAGPGRIQRAIDDNLRQGLPTDYWSLKLPTETMNYVPRFLAVAQIVADPAQYNVYFPAIANHNHFRAVPVQYGASLDEVAAITNVSVSDLQLLNPALTNLIVDRAGPSRVVIPDSLPADIDARLRQLGSQGFGSDIQQAYVVPKDARPNLSSVQELSAANTLPTTAASITLNQTIKQEPPLSPEEVDFIAAQIRSTESGVQPISPKDGAIELNAVQTAQSVLASRGEKKSLKFGSDNPSPQNNRTTATSRTNTNTVSDSNKPERYTVQSGDSLSSIAKQHNLTVAQLASYNNLAVDSKILVRQQLWLVDGKVDKTTASAGKTAAATTNTYKVQSGDTLNGLASRFGVSREEIAAVNSFGANDNLIAGAVINIPVVGQGNQANNQAKPSTSTSTSTSKKDTKPERYTVQSGDSLSSIAKQHNLTVAQLASYNNLAIDSKILVEQQLWLVDGKVDKTTTASTSANITNYTVKSGDTLNGLASRLGVSREEIAAINSFGANDNLIAGAVINIPVVSQANTQAKPSTSKKDAKTERYIIQAGDNLTSVANKYGISIASLAAANNISETALIVRGETLIIPATNTPAGRDSTSSTQATGRSFASTEEYKVQSGDTLSALATRYGVTINDLARLNNLTANTRLRAGQSIQVPKLTTNYTVKSGDTLNGLARRYGIDVNELAAMNNLKPTDGLRIKQVLIVPNK